jgi:hypothetical protein
MVGYPHLALTLRIVARIATYYGAFATRYGTDNVL